MIYCFVDQRQEKKEKNEDQKKNHKFPQLAWNFLYYVPMLSTLFLCISKILNFAYSENYKKRPICSVFDCTTSL